MTEFAPALDAVRGASPLGLSGRVSGVSGLVVSATGMPAPVGACCDIETGVGRAVEAQVIGFRGDTCLLMPLGDATRIAAGQVVRLTGTAQRVGVGAELLGRVVDARGQACDGGGPIAPLNFYPLYAPAPEAMQRRAIDAPLSVGVRAVNGLLSVGLGQRLGLFAGTGVGKSVLLGMMARYTSADVSVIALVGERGREVGAFVERDLGAAGMRRSVVVVSTSDQSPALRVRAAFVATAIAEYFRDQGANVLLLVDSITRTAMAQRQIGLAVGEPPATKGYPPSTFSLLPQVLERAGRTPRGSITGLYTVLVEGDDLTEPIADAARGILDGHVWLSRRLASRGHYPAIDVLESISRVMVDVVSADHARAARNVRRVMAIWSEIEELVNIGAYAPGSSIEFDLAIQMRPAIAAFVQQEVAESASFEASAERLMRLSGEIDQAEAALRARAAGELAPRGPARPGAATRERPAFAAPVRPAGTARPAGR